MEIVPTPFKRSKKYVLSFVTDNDDVEDVERLQSILVEQFKARLLTPTNYEEVLTAENVDGIERSLILIANCFEDPARYHSITESAPVPFTGYKGSQHTSQSSLPVSSYHSSQDLNLIDWGIYSTKEQNEESFVTTVSRFMAGLDSSIKNKLVIYPCVTESSYSDDGHFSRVSWEENDFPLSNCNKFLLHLNDLMKDKARPPPSVKKVKHTNITSPIQLQQDGRERGRRSGEFKQSAEKETIPINNVTTFTNHSPEHSSKNFPELNFYTTQKYFLSLITDSNVEVEKIRSVVVGEYKAIEITVENYEEIMKGEDGKVRLCYLLLIILCCDYYYFMLYCVIDSICYIVAS